MRIPDLGKIREDNLRMIWNNGENVVNLTFELLTLVLMWVCDVPIWLN